MTVARKPVYVTGVRGIVQLRSLNYKLTGSLSHKKQTFPAHLIYSLGQIIFWISRMNVRCRNRVRRSILLRYQSTKKCFTPFQPCHACILF